VIRLLLLLSACEAAPPPEPPPPPPPPEPVWPVVLGEVSVLGVGDLLMHTNVKKSATAADIRGPDGASTNRDGFVALFEEVDHLVADADLAFANLETPVAPRSNRGTASFVFNVSPSLLPALVDVGFDVVSFANNHSYDQGREGFVETLEQLEAANLRYIGAGRTRAEAFAARTFTVDGVDVAWIGCSDLFNNDLNLGPDEAFAATLDEASLLAEVAAARQGGAELVVLSVHWGVEYRTTPEPRHVDAAHRLVEGGVDLVLGHHPHVVQPVETVVTSDGRTAVIAYSLGNFISNQRYDYRFPVSAPRHGEPRDGLAVRTTWRRVDRGPAASPREVVEFVGVEPIPLWTDNDAGAAVVAAPRIRTVVVDEALDAALAATSGEDPTDPSGRVALLRLRRERVAAILGDALPARPDDAPEPVASVPVAAPEGGAPAAPPAAP
jgi:hypothetical protein